MLKHLDCFGKDEFAIHALGCEEADLTGFCIALVQTLERYALTVTYPVIREITECNRLCTRRRFRSERRGEDALSENGIELPVTERGLPKVLTVGVLKFADDFNRGIVENPDCVFAVRSLKRIEQVDEFVRRDGFFRSRRYADFCASCGVENAGGLTGAVTDEERANSLVK